MVTQGGTITVPQGDLAASGTHTVTVVSADGTEAQPVGAGVEPSRFLTWNTLPGALCL